MNSKICKQCGMLKPLDQFRKYVPRGKGIYNTTQGHFTMCGACEQLGRDVKAMLAKGMSGSDFNGLRAKFSQPGWTPVLKPIKDALGVVDQQPKETSEMRQAALRGAATLTVDNSVVIDFIHKLENRDYEKSTDAWDTLDELQSVMLDMPLFENVQNRTYLEDVTFSDESTVFEYAEELISAWEADEVEAEIAEAKRLAKTGGQ